jgi:two-component system, NtrC family, sensor kinase
MRRLSGTARRLLVAFGALLAIFAAASAYVLLGLAQVNDALRHVADEEAGVRATLDLARAVRDQYAHQAHTIILGDESHLPLYEEARERVARLTREALERAPTPADRALVLDIQQAGGEIDVLFRETIVPSVLARDAARVQREHDRLLSLVGGVETRADALADRYERAIEGFEARAASVQRSRLGWTMALLGGASLFAAGIGLYIGRSVARPVARLGAGAAKVAGGDLSTRIAIEGDDEFARLARQFNSMTASLEDHQARLVQSEKLAGLGRLAAGVAHEINNPLGVILGYVRLMKRKADGPLLEDLRIIEDEAMRCQDIVDGLLDLSRPIRVDDAEVDLRELCDEMVSRLSETGALGGVEVKVSGGATVQGSDQRLRQVLLNLLRNAVEVSAGGVVEVEIDRSGGDVRLSVSDSGPGVAPEHRSRLFEPFFTTKPQGTGLGLAVSQAIARAHGGAIEAGASGRGGARFTLRLPAEAKS